MTSTPILRGKVVAAIYQNQLLLTIGFTSSSTNFGEYSFKIVELANCPVGCPLCISATTCDTACTSIYKEAGAILGTYVCYTKPTVPDGKGINPSSGLLEACTDTNCKRCEDNKDICEWCIQGSPSNVVRYLLNSPVYSPKPVCITSPFPDGYGETKPPIQGNPKASRCTISNCKLCSADSTICTECFASFYLDTLIA